MKRGSFRPRAVLGPTGLMLLLGWAMVSAPWTWSATASPQSAAGTGLEHDEALGSRSSTNPWARSSTMLRAGHYRVVTFVDNGMHQLASGIGTLRANSAGCLMLDDRVLAVPTSSTLDPNGSVKIAGTLYRLGDTMDLGGGTSPDLYSGPCGQDLTLWVA